MRANNAINTNLSDKQPNTDDQDAEQPQSNKGPNTVTFQPGHSVLGLIYHSAKYKI